MKQFVCIALILLSILSFPACKEPNDHSEIDISTIESEPITDGVILKGIPVYPDCAILPLCDVITGLGFTLTWESEDQAYFHCNGKKYALSLSEETVTEYGNEENYLIPAPGNSYFYCEVVDATLLVDDNTVGCLFYTFLEYPVTISIDREAKTATIEKRQ